MVMRTIFGLIITLALVSCGGKTARHPIDGDSIAFKYATLPSIVEYDEFTVVTLQNPWKDGKALHTYVLVPRDAQLPVHLPSGTVIPHASSARCGLSHRPLLAADGSRLSKPDCRRG